MTTPVNYNGLYIYNVILKASFKKTYIKSYSKKKLLTNQNEIIKYDQLTHRKAGKRNKEMKTENMKQQT